MSYFREAGLGDDSLGKGRGLGAILRGSQVWVTYFRELGQGPRPVQHWNGSLGVFAPDLRGCQDQTRVLYSEAPIPMLNWSGCWDVLERSQPARNLDHRF